MPRRHAYPAVPSGAEPAFARSVTSILDGDPEARRQAIDEASLEVLKAAVAQATTQDQLRSLSKARFTSVRTLVAGHPNTSSLTLNELAKDCEVQVQKAVAGNPNTSSSTLEELAEIESCSLYVAKNEKAPVALLAKLSRHATWHTRYCVAANARTPLGVLTSLGEDSNTEVRMAVARNGNTSLAMLTTLSQDKEWCIQRSVAENPHTPPSVLAALASRGDWYINAPLARNPSTPESILEGFLGTHSQKECIRTLKNKGCYKALARHPKTPFRVLIELLSHETKTVQELAAENLLNQRLEAQLALAQSPAATAVILSKLAGTPNVAIQAAVAMHPQTALTDLCRLAELPATREEAVDSLLGRGTEGRILAARVPGLQDDIQERLATDPEWLVRFEVARRSHTPKKWIRALLKDPVQSVREAALKQQEKQTPELQVSSTILSAALGALLERVHPVLPLLTPTGQNLALSDQVEKALQPRED